MCHTGTILLGFPTWFLDTHGVSREHESGLNFFAVSIKPLGILFVNSGNDCNFFLVVELVTHEFSYGGISHTHFLWQRNRSHIIIVGVELVTLILLLQQNRSHWNFSGVTNSTLIFFCCDHFHPLQNGWVEFITKLWPIPYSQKKKLWSFPPSQKLVWPSPLLTCVTNSICPKRLCRVSTASSWAGRARRIHRILAY